MNSHTMWPLTHAPAYTQHTHKQVGWGWWGGGVHLCGTTLQVCRPRLLVGEMNQFHGSVTYKFPALISQLPCASPDLCSPLVSLHCTLDGLVSAQVLSVVSDGAESCQGLPCNATSYFSLWASLSVSLSVLGRLLSFQLPTLNSVR